MPKPAARTSGRWNWILARPMPAMAWAASITRRSGIQEARDELLQASPFVRPMPVRTAS